MMIEEGYMKKDAGGEAQLKKGLYFEGALSKLLPVGAKELRAFTENGPGPGTLMHAADRYFPGFEFRPAETAEEFEAAMHIAYKEYSTHGYVGANESRLKLALHQLLPVNTTFIAVYRRGYVLGTLSAVEDSDIGLPMEGTYHEELNKLRKEGRRIAEATSLAVDSRLVSEGRFHLSIAQRRLLMFHLIRAMYDHLRMYTKVDTLAACFHPKHDSFYDFLDMTPFGGLKEHKSVSGSPALARLLDIPKALQEGPSNTTCRLMFGQLPRQKKPVNKLIFSRKELKKIMTEYGLGPFSKAANWLEGLGLRNGQPVVFYSPSGEADPIAQAAENLGAVIKRVSDESELDALLTEAEENSTVVITDDHDIMKRLSETALNGIRFATLVKGRRESEDVALYEVLLNPPISHAPSVHIWPGFD